MALTTKKGKAVRSKDVELRDTYFADAADRLWDRNKHDGYATVPKTMPMVMRAIDELSKGKPLGPTYFALFCATWDNGFVRLARSPDLPYASGFTGPRGVRVWQERMKLLEEFGFVEIEASGAQKFGLAFLPNPNLVLLNLWEKKKCQGTGPYDPPALAGLQEATMSAFLERAIDVGANDVTRAQAKLNAAKRPAEAEPAPKRTVLRQPKAAKSKE
ncbi:hypothetical protein [Blastomonas sp.]|uniref:hypothetical protein n=1 Tax=Blastomonas sp. TaxID=1909299 RepID=UPI002618671A|nr:hypothetical protein [Blastomonas sp.]MDM7955576.1 hypothetical protein [Blastomonas sp.]